MTFLNEILFNFLKNVDGKNMKLVDKAQTEPSRSGQALHSNKYLMAAIVLDTVEDGWFKVLEWE